MIKIYTGADPHLPLHLFYAIHVTASKVSKAIPRCSTAEHDTTTRFQVLTAIWFRIQVFWVVVLSQWMNGSQPSLSTVVPSSSRGSSSTLEYDSTTATIKNVENHLLNDTVISQENCIVMLRLSCYT